MMNKIKARITGLGSYLPEKILTNQDLEALVDTSDEWITSRTGIKERRIAAADEFTSDMGFKAAEKAIAQARVSVKDIDMILVATMTPDYASPSTAGIIQAKLGATKAAAMDVQAACTGFIYVLSLAKAYIESGIYCQVLVIASEKMSSILDYTDRNTCVIFGDGAAAAVVSAAGAGFAIETVDLGSDGSLADLVVIPGGGSRHPASHEVVDQKLCYIKMAGREVFKHAVRRMAAAARECLARSSMTMEDLAWLVPHQANIRIIEAIASNLDFPMEKIYLTLQKYGNTSGSSVAIALEELVSKKDLKEDDRLLLLAFGGGLTWGATILRKCSE